jgi:energy-coupling factor transport system permease protein
VMIIMFNEHLLIGQYYPSLSPIHRLNGRVKIIAALLYMIALFVVDDWWGWAALGIVAIVTMIIAAIPIKTIAKGLKAVFVFCIFITLLNFFIYPGEVIFNIGPLTISQEGIIYGLAMGLRLLLLVLFSSLLTLTTRPIELTDSLESLMSIRPRFRQSAHEIAMMMSIALRFIPTILSEFDRIVLAQRARGAIINQGNIIKRVKAFIPMLVPLFIAAFRRAEELAHAMEAKCYRGGQGRSKWRISLWKWSDTVVLIVFLLLFIGAIVYRIY